MREPIVKAAGDVLVTAIGDLRPAIEGASPEALNWRPVGHGTNSIAVLAVHMMHSTRMWLSVATSAPLPKRDRDSEFVAEAADYRALLSIVDGLVRDCETLLDDAGQVDWSAMRETQPRPRPGVSDQVTAAYALIHACSHLLEHVGQITLTRQLWDARTDG